VKILFAATPVAGHLNPLLAIARMALARGDEALIATGSNFRSAVEKVGARFLPLAREADAARPELVLPSLANVPPGPALLRHVLARLFLDPMPAQLDTLRTVIAQERPDIVVTESMFMGRAALFLDPERPPVPLVSCGITFLPLERPDGAPTFLGLPPTEDVAERANYAAIAAAQNAVLTGPLRDQIVEMLSDLSLPQLPCSVYASWALLADGYLHPTVPAFEYDYGDLPAHVRFVGALPPLLPRDLPQPSWWSEFDSARDGRLADGRQIVLLTQGTVANTDFGELVEPTLAALADQDDLVVVVTTGGRPLSDVRGPIPSNARLAEFLDYAALLPRVSALVTNGGYGTVSLALRAGVPIVAAGRTEDKAEVGARVAWSGVGVEIPSQRPSVADLRQAVERVLSEPSYRSRAKVIADDMAAIDTRAEILGVLDGLVAGSMQRTS
jgi:UDP:flavonoid glycosyltransferase YjiC (YdhE family)